jgi:hypothetical protein
MNEILDILEMLVKSPIANLLILAGLAFLGIAVVGNVSGKIHPGTGGRLLSGLLGISLLGGGLSIYSATKPDSEPATTPTPTHVLVSNPTATENNPVVFNPTLTPDIVPVADSPTPVPPTLTLVPPLPNEEYVDTGTQEQGMHACPVGFAIAGVHLESNLFLCRRVVHYGDENYVMTIFDAGPGTQRADMHACPDGTYMRGLRADQNNLLCSYDSRRGQPQDWLTEFEDTNSQDYDMHTCPATSGNISFLTGIRADQNRFLCGIYNP